VSESMLTFESRTYTTRTSTLSIEEVWRTESQLQQLDGYKVPRILY